MDAESDEKILNSIKSKIKPETIREIMKMGFKDPKTKLPEDSLILVNEILKTLVLETALRGAKQAVCDHRTVIELEQVEKVLPQLLLDFP